MGNSAFTPQSGSDKKTQRQHPRYYLSWRIALVADESGERRVFHGKTRDLSLFGASMHTQDDTCIGGSLIVLLAPPPLSTADGHKIIEIKARVVYSVYSSGSMCFRLGLQFNDYIGDSRLVLEKRLEHHSGALEVRPSRSVGAA